MGDAIITFVAVLVGAAASLAGSVVVNRMERRTAIRQQIYMIAADLVPKMDEVVRLRDPLDDTGKQLDTMQRLGAIAGKDERQLTFEVWQQWLKAENAHARQDLPDMNSGGVQVAVEK